jgi:hypothetical protein
MNLQLILENLTNPALLFFVLGILAVRLKSDLEIPSNSSKFISLYLLFAIGFKGGQELAHAQIGWQVVLIALFGMAMATCIPLYSFFILKRKMSIENAGAIAAAYGSVSAVTFITSAEFLEFKAMEFGGHMVAVMALMEVPAIVVGVLLIKFFSQGENQPAMSMRSIVHHALTNGSVLLIVGSLVIGYLASDEQAMGIKPFTTDLFKGFMALFLLDMGISSGKKIKDFIQLGWFPLVMAIAFPLLNGIVIAWLSQFVTHDIGDRFMLSILAASASYIAVPAAMKIAVPKANNGIFIPMALAITFPFNITLGMPLYFWLCSVW